MMTPLEEKLIESVDTVLQWAEKAASLTEEQAPLVVWEVIKRGIVIETWFVFCAAIVLIAMVTLTRVIYLKLCEAKFLDKDHKIVFFAL